MTSRFKRLPRLWCALQGLLPLDACPAAQREVPWRRAFTPALGTHKKQNRIAVADECMNVPRRGPLRNQS
jgi:hypothetical protein